MTVEKALKRKSINPVFLNVVAFLGSNTAIKEAVKKGIGFGLVSKYSIQRELECNKLKTVKIEGFSIKRSFYAVRRNDITPMPAARTLWDNLEKFFN